MSSRIAAAVHEARDRRGWSAAELARRSDVSRAMIGKLEAADVQPTAALLARIAAAFGMTLTDLIAGAEAGDGGLRRVADQPLWTDPQTGYVRRAVSPASAGAPQLVQVTLPALAEVAFAAETYAFIHQQIWVLDGRLVFREGDVDHDLRTGDCLSLRSEPVPCVFRNPSRRDCRYLVVVAPRYR